MAFVFIPYTTFALEINIIPETPSFNLEVKSITKQSGTYTVDLHPKLENYILSPNDFWKIKIKCASKVSAFHKSITGNICNRKIEVPQGFNPSFILKNKGSRSAKASFDFKLFDGSRKFIYADDVNILVPAK